MVTAESLVDLVLPPTISLIQLGWGTCNSAVSSMLTIFPVGGIKVVTAFSKVVLPDAVWIYALGIPHKHGRCGRGAKC